MRDSDSTKPYPAMREPTPDVAGWLEETARGTPVPISARKIAVLLQTLNEPPDSLPGPLGEEDAGQIPTAPDLKLPPA